jgi:hypothetical protein
MNPEILDYIRANWTRYTREALTKQLVDAGHDRAAVDEAWQAVVAEAEAAAGPNPWPRFWRAFGLTALVGAVLIVVGWSQVSFFGSTGGIILAALLVYGVALLVPFIVGAAIVGFSRPRVSATTLAGMALWVPIILVGLSAGTCIAIGINA